MAADLTYHRLKYSSLVWVALAFGIFAIVGFYSARMTNDYPGYDHDRAQQRLATKDQVDKSEDKQLNPTDDQGKPTAVWVDQDKGLIQIPIEQAMTHELADLKNEPLGPGALVPGVAAPAPPPPASAPATNAAPAKPGTPPSTNAAPAKPAAPPAPAAKPKKKPVKPAPAVTTTSTVLSPGEINQPVFNTRKVKTSPGTTFEGFITYGGVPINPSTGNIVMKAPTTGTN